MTDKTARDYEREAENARMQLAGTLDELRLRITPSNMVDEVKNYARSHVVEPAKDYAKDRLRTYTRGYNLPMAAGAAYVVRRHPVSALLIGAGAYMLWRSYSSDGHAERDLEERRYAHPAYRGALRDDGDRDMSRDWRGRDLRDRDERGMMSDAGDRARGYGAQARDYVSEQSDSLSQRVEETTDSVRRRAHDLRDQARETASGVYEQVSDYASSARDTAYETAEYARGKARQAERRVRMSLEEMVEEQPWSVLALGLVAGAAIGALLPRTRAEEEWVGETARGARRQAKRMARDQYERVKNVASSLADDIQDEAHRQGLDTESLSEAAQDVTQKVKDAAKNVGTKARDRYMNDDQPTQQAAQTSGSGQMGGQSTTTGLGDQTR